MSTRQLRKLRQQQEELLKKSNTNDEQLDGSHDEEEDEELESLPSAKPRASLFAALADDDDDNDNESDKESIASEDKQPSEPTPAPSATETKRTKKSKKKKKKAKGSKGQKTVEELNEPAGGGRDRQDEDLDQILKELNIAPKVAGGEDANESSPESLERRVLHINLHNLRAINEMVTLFGREAIVAADAEDESEQQAARRRQQRGPAQTTVDLETFLKGEPGKKLSELSLRRNIFIQGKEHWPVAGPGGLSMKRLSPGAEPGGEYTFTHDKEYDGKQVIFFRSVLMGDPMRLVYVLKQFPYHVSTLLQVSAFAKQDQNQALSADLCERALFAFGRVTTSAFRRDLEAGTARLDFRRPENRQFWLAGYHYIRSLMRKGTFRTALEWAKVLFSLDPVSDPYGMNHWIHVFAVKAHEPEWLTEYLELVSRGKLHDESMYYRNTLALAKLQQDDTDGARDFLVQQIESMPWLFCALFQALGLDAPPSIWGVTPGGEGDKFYTELYVHLTKDIWKNPRAMTVLVDAAKAARKKTVEGGINPLLELRTARFIFLDGTTGLLGMVPKEYIDTHPNYESDPLPPRREDNIFSTRGTELPWGHDDNNADIDALRNFMNRARAGAGRRQVGMDSDDDAADEIMGLDSDEDDDPDYVGDILNRDLVDNLDDGTAGSGMMRSLFEALMGIIRPGTEPNMGVRGEGEEEELEGEDTEGEAVENTQESTSRPPGAWPPEEDEHRDGETREGEGPVQR